MKNLLALLVALFLALPCFADTVSANKTATQVTVTSSSLEVDLNSVSSSVDVTNTSASDTLYFSYVSPATTSGAPIIPGATFCYVGSGMNKFFLVSGGSNITAGVNAH